MFPLTWISYARRLILFITVAMMIWFLFNLIRFKPWQEVPVAVGDRQLTWTGQAWVEGLLASTGNRWFKSQANIFAMDASVPDDLPKMAKGQLPGNIKVVGIVRAKPSMLVIEDTAQAKTYFLPEDKIIDAYRLVSIKQGKAVLVYQGQTFEIPVK